MVAESFNQSTSDPLHTLPLTVQAAIESVPSQKRQTAIWDVLAIQQDFHKNIQALDDKAPEHQRLWLARLLHEHSPTVKQHHLSVNAIYAKLEQFEKLPQTQKAPCPVGTVFSFPRAKAIQHYFGLNPSSYAQLSHYARHRVDLDHQEERQFQRLRRDQRTEQTIQQHGGQSAFSLHTSKLSQ